MATEVGHTLVKIRSYLNSLTKTESIVAEYVIQHADEIIYLSVTELAEKAHVGETTVLRFCRKLGFRGFQDFKLSLAQDLVQPTNYLNEELLASDDAATLSRKIIASNSSIMQETGDLLSPDQLECAIDLFVKAETLHFYGVGASGLTALQAAHSFTRIGKYCNAYQDSHFQAMAASLLSENDVAVGFSISGSTKDTINSLELARETGAKVVCITHNARSPITKLADVELLMAAKENPLQGSSLPAKISQLVVVDILYSAVLLRMQDKALEFRERTARAVSEKLY